MTNNDVEAMQLIWEIKRYRQGNGIIEEHIPLDKKGEPHKIVKRMYFVFVTVDMMLSGNVKGPTLREPAEIKGCENIYQAYKKAPRVASEKAAEMRARMEDQINGPKIIAANQMPPTGPGPIIQ